MHSDDTETKVQTQNSKDILILFRKKKIVSESWS